MNGATTDPWASINNPPNITITMIIGANQSFFLIAKNCKSSFKNSIETPLYQYCLSNFLVKIESACLTFQ